MAKLAFLFKSVTVAEERDFERQNIARKTERYLQTNPLDRAVTDPAYGLKLDHIRKGLEQESGQPLKGLILDLGGNTAGEATVLQQQGLSFVVGDLNEIALEVSRKRVRKFQLRAPVYVAMDAQELPFANASFSAVTVIEALHHFPDYARVLAEIHRVLKPGGIFYSHEPNALNPLRRLSEVRDRLRGTIEKSFRIGQVQRLCRQAGFEQVRVRAVPFGTSTWKVQEVPIYRRPLTYFHGFLMARVPRFFGPLDIRARKAGVLTDTAAAAIPWQTLLRSPLNRFPLKLDPASGRWVEIGGKLSFPDLEGIPILISGDGQAQPNPNVAAPLR